MFNVQMMLSALIHQGIMKCLMQMESEPPSHQRSYHQVCGHIAKVCRAMKSCLLVEPDSCSTRSCLVQEERVSSCSTRRGVFLQSKKTCPPVQQEDMSSCSTGRSDLAPALLGRPPSPVMQGDFASHRLLRTPPRPLDPRLLAQTH